MIKITCEIPMPHPSGLKYKGIAFDGCYYYLTCPECCEILKYDLHFCIIETIKTLKPYTCICFDPERNCFWAGAAKYQYKLFKIDLCFREIDCVSIPRCADLSGVITAISYECRRKGLLVCNTNGVLFLCPDAPIEYELLQKSCVAWNMGATSVAPSYLMIELQNAKQFVCVYNCISKLLCKYEIPYGYMAEAVLFFPCEMYCTEQPHFYLLATKNGCYPYLFEFTLPCCEIDICQCNYDICRQCCNPCPQPPCPNPEEACADLMESIALIETALSHILNAEGEKLQKAIEATDDIDKILSVNKSIQETIVSITHLEIILYDKLTAIRQCCDICEDDK